MTTDTEAADGSTADGATADQAGAPWLTADERAAWLAVAALTVRLPAALDAQLQCDDGLSFFEYMVLAVLSEQPDRSMQMTDIARFASSSLSRLSHTATRLEKAGYLTRQRVPGGGRRTCATLTDAGLAAVVAAAPGHVREVRRLIVDLATAEELAALAGVGRKFLQVLESDEG